MVRRRQHFAVRTIRNGRVRILGHEYEPSRESAERFNGMRAAFGLYWGPAGYDCYDERGLLDAVSLWGSEEQYQAKTDEESERLWPGPFCEDGYFKWEWWRRVDTQPGLGAGE